MLIFGGVRNTEKKFKSQIIDELGVKRALMRISHEIVENCGNDSLYIVGIKRRGVPLSEIIADNIEKIEGKKPLCGQLDIKFYRDDLSNESETPTVRNCELEADVTGKTVVLVDDVLYTGRTVRAAIEAIFSLGRPSKIKLAILVDRGHRELPLRADFVGKNIPTSRNEIVNVRIPPFDSETGVFLYEKV